MALDADDLLQFFDPDMPGYVEATIGSTVVGGLFSELSGEAFGMISGTRPVLTVPATSASLVVHGAAVTIESRSYTISSSRSTQHVIRIALEESP